jgi:hypothetical protein
MKKNYFRPEQFEYRNNPLVEKPEGSTPLVKQLSKIHLNVILPYLSLVFPMLLLVS